MKQEGPSPAPAACGFPHGTLLDGQASAGLAGKAVGIVVSRYNPRVTEPLLEGASRTLLGAGLAAERLVVARVPGAFELPLAADRLAAAGGFDAILCLGAIIRGETTHDRHIADAVAGGIEAVARARGIPVVFGVLTCQTLEQALARAGGDATVPRHSHKGEECAQAAIEMVALLDRIAVTAMGRRA